MGKYIRCPKCKCEDLIVLENNRNDVGYGLLGYALTGSLFAGAVASNMRKSVYQCSNCGKVFKKE